MSLKWFKGFLATPFIVIGGFLFFTGFLIRFGLEFSIKYVEAITAELGRMKKQHEEDK